MCVGEHGTGNGMSLIGPPGTNFNEIDIKIQKCSVKKMYWKCRPQIISYFSRPNMLSNHFATYVWVNTGPGNDLATSHYPNQCWLWVMWYSHKTNSQDGINSECTCKIAFISPRGQWVNPSPPSATYMRRWIAAALVQIMACRLFGAKP